MRERESVPGSSLMITRRTAEFKAYLEANYPGLSLDEAERLYRHQKRLQEYHQQRIDNARKSEERGKMLFVALVALVLLLAYLFL